MPVMRPLRYLQQLLMLDELLPKNQGATKEMIANNTSLQQFHKIDCHENESCIICITDFQENDGIRLVNFQISNNVEPICGLPSQWRNFGLGRPSLETPFKMAPPRKSSQTYTLSIFSRNPLMKTQIFAKLAPP